MDKEEREMTEDREFQEEFWKDPEKVMRLLDLIFLGKDEGEFRIMS